MHLQPAPAFWGIPTGDLLKQLETTSQGLGEDEAKARLRLYGTNLLKPRKRTDALTLLRATEDRDRRHYHHSSCRS